MLTQAFSLRAPSLRASSCQNGMEYSMRRYRGRVLCFSSPQTGRPRISSRTARSQSPSILGGKSICFWACRTDVSGHRNSHRSHRDFERVNEDPSPSGLLGSTSACAQAQPRCGRKQSLSQRRAKHAAAPRPGQAAIKKRTPSSSLGSARIPPCHLHLDLGSGRGHGQRSTRRGDSLQRHGYLSRKYSSLTQRSGRSRPVPMKSELVNHCAVQTVPATRKVRQKRSVIKSHGGRPGASPHSGRGWRVLTTPCGGESSASGSIAERNPPGELACAALARLRRPRQSGKQEP
jgi:hypothetical protein